VATLTKANGQFVAAYSLMKAGLQASRTLFEKAWNGVMASPASWHDRTPSGRVISRFSKDIAQLDDKLTATWGQFLTNALGVVGTFGLIAYTYPWLCLVFAPLLAYIVSRHSIRC
jgi:ABC-type multidrug transport system fused ATPase/permease subunit